MPIAFTAHRWANIRETYRRWWAGELDRPVFNISVHGRDPGRPEPNTPSRSFVPFYDRDVSPKSIVDRWDWDLSRREWVADGFPSIWPNFGAGVLAAMVGGRLRATPETETVWFEPKEEREIAEIEFRWDPDNAWLCRIRDLVSAARDRWRGLVQIGTTDLGGNLDVLSTFRPSKRLLLDLIDHPDEVKRLTWQEHEVWWRAFNDLNAAVHPENPGYTAWTPIYSESPYYMLQCDFCYMISPAMFDEFVLPELAASCRRLGNAFYHLDGPGELPHLDSLLSIPELKGIQWVPGAGQPELDQWPEVHRKVRAAGKLVQIGNGRSPDGRWFIDTIAEQVGGAEGIVVIGQSAPDERDDLMRMLERYGAA